MTGRDAEKLRDRKRERPSPPICAIFPLLGVPFAVALTTNGDVSMSQVLSETHQTDREEDGLRETDQHIHMPTYRYLLYTMQVRSKVAFIGT